MNDTSTPKEPQRLVEAFDLASEIPQLLDDEIQIWIGLPQSNWGRQLEPKTLLPDSEREQLFNHSIEIRRETRVLARCLTRMLIGHFLQTKPKSVRFTSNAYGKPQIDPNWNPTPVQFNVSHCDQGIAVALARHRRVGIDIEPADRDTNHEGLAKRYFPDEDLRAYQNVPPSEKQRQFLKTWTQLEAAVKAHGGGLTLVFQRQIPLATSWPRFSIPTPTGLIAAVCSQAPTPTRLRVLHL